MTVAPATGESLLPAVGELLGSKYRIERCIGRGGMGAVYQARHEVLNHVVAIKFLLPKVAQNEAAVTRFINEARAAAQIGNEHVARVLDVEHLPDRSAFMVLEYLDGADLNASLARTGPLPLEEAVSYVLQALQGIAAAHAMGIVHRDLKPANLFLTPRPDGTSFVKVLDFGISKASDPVHSLTATNSLLGSPSYMSPEQVRSSKSVDARSDIWSIGVCLYQLVTGELPFRGENFGEVFAAILEDQPLLPSLIVPRLPASFDLVIGRCLARDREARYQNAAELAEALAAFAPEAERDAAARIRNILAAKTSKPNPVPAGFGVHTPYPGPTDSRPKPVFRRDLPVTAPERGQKAVANAPVPDAAASAPDITSQPELAARGEVAAEPKAASEESTANGPVPPVSLAAPVQEPAPAVTTPFPASAAGAKSAAAPGVDKTFLRAGAQGAPALHAFGETSTDTTVKGADPRGPRPRRVGLIVAVAAALALGAFLVWQSRSEPEPASPSAAALETLKPVPPPAPATLAPPPPAEPSPAATAQPPKPEPAAPAPTVVKPAGTPVRPPPVGAAPRPAEPPKKPAAAVAPGPKAPEKSPDDLFLDRN